jgi:hypothetical protein
MHLNNENKKCCLRKSKYNCIKMKVKQVLSRGGHHWGWGHRKSVKEGEYGGCNLYSYVKIEE